MSEKSTQLNDEEKMKKIDVVPFIHIDEVVLPSGAVWKDKDFTMKEWVTTLLDMYSGFGKGPKGIRQGIKIYDAFQSSNDYVVLDDGEYGALLKALNEVTLAPKIARLCISFYEAVEKAQDANMKKLNKDK